MQWDKTRIHLFVKNVTYCIATLPNVCMRVSLWLSLNPCPQRCSANESNLIIPQHTKILRFDMFLQKEVPRQGLCKLSKTRKRYGLLLLFHITLIFIFTSNMHSFKFYRSPLSHQFFFLQVSFQYLIRYAGNNNFMHQINILNYSIFEIHQ